jgi:large subunit ribosomal protein L13
MKTYTPKAGELEEKWYIVDAENQVVGRLAARIAKVLRGKHLPTYAPHWDMGTHVVVINADKARLTGRKWRDKIYYHHTGYPGGIRSTTATQLNQSKPGEVLRHAVYGMLPKNRLGRAMRKRLRVFAGPTHRHAAQRPEPLDLHTRQVREE